MDLCDADKMSVEELKSMARELGHTYDVLFFYVEPGAEIKFGLKVLRSDVDIIKICQWVANNKVLDVYCVKHVKFPNLPQNKQKPLQDVDPI